MVCSQTPSVSVIPTTTPREREREREFHSHIQLDNYGVCGYEVPGMILLSHLKGAMRFES
jgi:hypothetical protein